MSDRDHERFADWDGAYVLGALTPSDRHAFEAHLESCPRCREAVTELAPMPGLLGQIRPEMLEQPTAEDPLSAQSAPTAATQAPPPVAAQAAPPAATQAPPPVAAQSAPPEAARSESARPAGRTRPPRGRILVAALAAAAVLVLAIVLPLTLEDRDEDAAVTVAVLAAGETPPPMEVDVELAPRAWGTSLTITCDYPAPSATGPAGYGGYGGSTPPPTYALVVTAEDGTRNEASSWRGVPGTVMTLEAATALDLEDIASVSVVDPAGTVVLTAEVDAP